VLENQGRKAIDEALIAFFVVGENSQLHGCGPLQRAVPSSNRSLQRRGVDGRDKPGHDDGGSKRNRRKSGPGRTILG